VTSTVPPGIPLLGSVGEISVGWMRDVLSRAGFPGAQLAGVACRRIGHGNVGETVVAELEYEGDPGAAPRSLVCKFTATLPVAKGMAEAAGVYRREVETYRLLGSPSPVRVPRVYLAETDDAGRCLNLVMEDLSVVANPGDQLAGCSPADAQAAVAEFAALHARFWNDPALDGLDWLFGAGAGPAEAAAQRFELTARVAEERYGKRLPEEVFATVRAFAARAGDWLTAEPRRRTVIHREARVDNVLFDRREPDHPRAYLIDWQFTSRGDPQFDVAYFASGSLTPEDRRACERSLVASHAARIQQIDPGYSFEEALESYRFYLPSGLVTTLSAALILPPGDHEDLLLMTLLSRNVAAIRDWGLGGE